MYNNAKLTYIKYMKEQLIRGGSVVVPGSKYIVKPVTIQYQSEQMFHHLKNPFNKPSPKKGILIMLAQL